jgi:hypothetical protein
MDVGFLTMPFQGNANAGAVDPTLVKMLFDQKARREEMALQDQIEQAKFARQMAIDAKNEARADEKHKLDMLTLRAGLADKLRAMAPDVDTASRTAQDVTSKNFTEQDLMGDGGGQDFAGIVAQNDPTTFDQVGRSNMAEANLATQLALGSDLQMAMAPGADRGMAIDATLGAGQAVEADRARTAEIALEKTTDAENRAERRAMSAEARAERRAIAAEERALARTIAAERRAADNGGQWDTDDLNTFRKDREGELKVAFDTSKEWRRLEATNPRNALDVLEVLQRWQRKVDQGATVREGDIDLIRSVGASGVENAFSSAKAFFDENGRFPDGFGEELKRSYASMLRDDDISTLEKAEAIEDYADQNGWDEDDRNRAIPYRKQIEQARQRVNGNGPAGQADPAAATITPAEFNRIAKELSAATRIPLKDVPNEMVLKAWKTRNAGPGIPFPAELGGGR